MNSQIFKMASAWALLYVVILGHTLYDGAVFNIPYLTMLIPLVLRSIIVNFPSLAIDYKYLFATSFLTAITVGAFMFITPDLRNGVEEYGKDKNQTRKATALMVGVFMFYLIAFSFIMKNPYSSFN